MKRKIRRLRIRVKHQGVFLFCSLAVAMVLLMVASASAQEFRASITGHVMDSTGAVVPNAQVTVTNTATNVSTSTTTDDAGSYTVLYLAPGQYMVTVEAQGFKKLVRRGIEVRVADKLTLDLTLEVGEVQETLTVTAEAGLLEAASASAGQLIDARRISDLPLSDRNPFTLARLAPGIIYTGELLFSRAFDNAGTAAIVANGAPGRNEYTLDGSPNMAHGGGTGGVGRVAFVPPSDAVQEFKVVTASFDAQHGHTAGANINVALKSGTNELHGSLYEFNRNDVFSANDFFLNRAGKPRSPVRYNLYGGTVGGPVWLPKIYNGRNKTFFFFSFEGLKDKFPEPNVFTVPTEAQRRGDLSALLSQGIIIYDPLTAVKEGNRIRRTPFPNNIIPQNRLSPIAQNFLKFYPLPNAPGDAQGRNNFVSDQPRSDDFDSETVRFDHNISEKQRFFARYSRNWRRELRYPWAGEVSGLMPVGNYLFRINNNGAYDHLYTFSPTMIFNFRVGFSRFTEPTVRAHEGKFNPADLGFPPQTAALFGGARYLPQFNIGGFSTLGGSIAGGTTFNIYSFQPTLTKITGPHSLRMGYDFRSYRENSWSPGHAAGLYTFDTTYTRGPLDNSPAAPIGQQLAAFLLGQPTGGQIDRNAARANQTLYNAIFFQDDWKATRKLTLNLGLRYELEGAATERYNRNVRGFDATSPSPIEAAAKAAYAANPDAALSPNDFKVRGGLLFADKSHRGFWDPDKNNFQPRLGLAYQLTPNTVVRGGWGVYMVPFIVDGVNQPGFSQSTLIVPSLDGGLTFVANLANPFPNGVADPPGSSLGLATFIGRDITFVPLDRKNGLSQRWEFSIQRQLPGEWLVEAAYIGNAGYDLTASINLNPVPAQYLSTLNVRDTAVINFLTANIPNPFQGLAPGTGLNGSVVQRQQLLRPFPQFTGVNTQRYDGRSRYHSGQLRVEKRFTHGYSLNAAYTWSKALEQLVLLNATDTQYEKRLTDYDTPHRLVINGVWDLPFGRGRQWGSDWHGVIDGFLGGWTVTVIYQAQCGRPLTLGNIAFYGDLRQLRAKITGDTVDRTFDKSGFYFHDAAVQTNGVDDPAKQRADSRIRLSYNIRTLPSRLPWFRGQGLNFTEISLIKNFRITEKLRLQLRADFLNAFNHPWFSNPSLDPTSSDFAKTTRTYNLPRNLQIGLRMTF